MCVWFRLGTSSSNVNVDFCRIDTIVHNLANTEFTQNILYVILLIHINLRNTRYFSRNSAKLSKREDMDTDTLKHSHAPRHAH